MRPNTGAARRARDEQVARRSAALAGRALALEPDPLPVLDAGRDPDRDACGCPSPGRCRGSRGTGRRRPGPGRGTRGTARRTRTRPALRLVWPGPWQVGQVCGMAPPRPPVPWQDGHGCSLVSRSGTVTPSTASSNARVTSTRRRRRGGPGCGPRRRCVAEEPAEDVAETAAARCAAEQVAEVEAARRRHRRHRRAAGTARRRRPNSVRASSYSLRRVGVGEHVVGLGDLLEPRPRPSRRPRWLVRVVLPGELAVGLLDLVGRRVLGDAERLVVVLLEVVALTHSGPPRGRERSERRRGVGSWRPPLVGRDRRNFYSGSATATRAGRTTRSPIR